MMQSLVILECSIYNQQFYFRVQIFSFGAFPAVMFVKNRFKVIVASEIHYKFSLVKGFSYFLNF